MARPNLQYEHQNASPDPGEWQELRSELVALLDQVETQVARTGPRQQGHGALSERMRDLRHQVAEIEPETRHRAALRSVQRAIDRFSDRDGPLPPNPRDTLADAIEQVRARHQNSAPRTRGGPGLDELAGAVGGISERLERLEGELKAQASTQTANVKEIAEQVGQLSHVVELLAGAVGETGQVKRLEAQLAGLARLITREQNVDLGALTSRIDDVTATVGRLADMQAEFASRAQVADGESMRGVEDGVRTIYDRLDAIERAMAVPQAELEKFTEQLQQFAAAMKAPQPQGLIELIDALNVRISDMEGQGPQVGLLKADVDALRDAVVNAMEPRFAALELQIEALADKVGEPTAGQIEAQVRELATRMDQAGAQLTDLAKMYEHPIDREGGGDLDALAEMVAKRTTAAMADMEPGQGFGAAAFDEIEKRVSRVMQAAAASEPLDENVALSSTIREVSERLSRLEASLTGGKPEQSEPEAKALVDAETAVLEDVVDELMAVEFVEDDAALAEFNEILHPAPPPADDEMPVNPNDEAPLLDRPFGDPTPLEAALAVKNGPRLPREVESARVPVELPPAPVSSLDVDFAAELREPEPASVEPAPVVEPEPVIERPAPAPVMAEPDDDRAALPNRNTFIAAHRRAVRMAAEAKAAPAAAADTSSLMGRAFARFQSTVASQSSPEVAAPAPVIAEVAADKAAPKGKSRFLGRGRNKPAEAPEAIEPQEAAATIAVEPVAAPEAPATEAGAEAEDRPSFLLRHRQPILLAAAVVALSCLAINFVNQRMHEGAEAASQPAPQKVGDASLVPTPLADQKLEIVAPKADVRVIPMTDTIQTASINPAAYSFAPVGKMPPMPQAFSAATALAAADPASAPVVAAIPAVSPPAIASPVKVELPPASVGPAALLQAAADGDARAQFEVAAIYTEGRAVPEDLKAAAVWYERSAVQGFAPAQYRLGSLYENGRGVDKDLAQARLWYQRSAEAGNRMGMHNLAALYASGGLGKQEFDAAARWFEEAANRGMTDSQFNLGMLYARGLGVKQDLATSYKWFALAAMRGDADAAKARDGVAASLDPAAVQRLNDEIAAWAPRPVDLVANFAPIGTWEKNFDPGQAIANVDVVKGVQKALVGLGYDVGTPDGLAGPKTEVAIRSFERATGMNESGAINPRLLAVLGSQPV